MAAQANEVVIARVLIVSDAVDALVLGFVEGLRGAGASVDPMGDVYSAILALSSDTGRAVRMMLVDVRTADRAELRVFEVAQRYFPWVVCGAMAASVDTTTLAHEPTRLTAGQAVARWRLLTGATDGGIARAAAQRSELESAGDDTGSELKLHDAVRLRMSADAGAAAVRRTPPRAAPKVDAEEPPASGAEVTPAELDALLRPDDGPDDARAEGAA